MKKYLCLILIAMLIIPHSVFALNLSKTDYTEGAVVFESDFQIFEPGGQPTGLGNTNAVGNPEWITVPTNTGGGIEEEENGNHYYRFANNTTASVTATFVKYFNMTTQALDAFKVEYDVRTMGTAFYARWRDTGASQNTFFMNLTRNASDVYSKNIITGHWNHFEAIVDNNKNMMQIWINGILATETVFQNVYNAKKGVCTLTFAATLYPGDEAFIDNVKVTQLIPTYNPEDIVIQNADVQETVIDYTPSKNGIPAIGEQIELGEAAFNMTSTQVGGGMTKLGHRTYVSMNANPSYMNEFDTLTGEFINSFPVAETSFYYAFQVGSDGNLHHTNGEEWYVYDPVTRKNELHATYFDKKSTTAWGMNLGFDGNGEILYNAHSSGTDGTEFNVKTGKYTIYENVTDGMTYMHGATGTDKYFFGSAGDDAGSEKIIRIDKETGEKKIWQNTDPDVTAGNCPHCIVVGDKVFAAIRQWVFCIDIETMQEVARFPTGGRGGRQRISYPMPGGDPDIIYFMSENQVGLNSFNLKTYEVKTVTEKFDDSRTDLGKLEFGQWVQKKDGTWAIYACATDQYIALITPGDPHVEYIELNPPANGMGSAVQANYYHITRDDMMYVGGYRAGINGFDLSANQPVFSVKQNSQHGISEANGMVFCGTYSSGFFYMIDPELPVIQDSGNPRYIYEAKYGCRHYNQQATNAGFCMLSGIADYGSPEGSVIMCTYADGKPMVKEYGGIIPGENIVGMTYKDGYVYASSSVAVNLHESHHEAHIVKVDARTGEIINTMAYNIPGMSEFDMIGEMAVGPDGMIYAIGNTGVTLLVIDPDTLELKRYKSYYKQRENPAATLSDWVRFGADGVLYTTMGDQLHAINIETLEAVTLWNNCDRFALDNDGNIIKRRGGNSSGIPLVSMQVDKRQRLAIMIENAEKYFTEDRFSKASWRVYQNALADAKKIDLYKDDELKVKDAARKLSFAIYDLQTKYDEEAGFAYIYGDNLSSFDDTVGYNSETLKAINTLKHSKIISGINNKTFAPEKSITRAEFVKLLTVIEGCEDEEYEAHDFSDVAKSEWYYNYIQAAYAKGWINGKSETEFAPDEPITEEQMILMLNRIREGSFEAGKPEETTRANAAKLLYDYINL